MPRFTRRYPAILETLMKQMLNMVHVRGSSDCVGHVVWLASVLCWNHGALYKFTQCALPIAAFIVLATCTALASNQRWHH
jgi:hypothetical protein